MIEDMRTTGLGRTANGRRKAVLTREGEKTYSLELAVCGWKTDCQRSMLVVPQPRTRSEEEWLQEAARSPTECSIICASKQADVSVERRQLIGFSVELAPLYRTHYKYGRGVSAGIQLRTDHD